MKLWLIDKKCGIVFRHLEFGLVDTTGMSEQQRREIPYTVIQSQIAMQCNLQSSNNRLNSNDSSVPRYDDLKTTYSLQSHPPSLEDETGSVVIVWKSCIITKPASLAPPHQTPHPSSLHVACILRSHKCLFSMLFVTLYVTHWRSSLRGGNFEIFF